jgi:hypothetical protein
MLVSVLVIERQVHSRSIWQTDLHTLVGWLLTEADGGVEGAGAEAGDPSRRGTDVIRGKMAKTMKLRPTTAKVLLPARTSDLTAIADKAKVKAFWPPRRSPGNF